MKNVILFLSILLSMNLYSQISFEQGYYLTNTNQKIEGLIKNEDWKLNPTYIEYKSSENSEVQKLTISQIKEFGINNTSKYIRDRVDIDFSSNNLNKLSYERKPVFETKTLFLKTIIEGEANLYLHDDGGNKRYFYNVNNSKTEQLIFKKYKITGTKVGTNNYYKQQLNKALKCSSINLKNVQNLEYKVKSLTTFFTNYNNCSNSSSTSFIKKEKRNLFNLSIRPRANYASLDFANGRSIRNSEIDPTIGFGIGLEAEFTLPFNKNKWSILVEPSYHNYTSEQENSNGRLVNTDYKYIEIPIGVRHYMFLNDNSKLFLNGSFVLNFTNENSMIYFNSSPGLDISPTLNFALGFGYVYDKLSLELRYYTPRNILSDYIEWNSNFRNISLIVGYSIFNKKKK